MKLSALIGRTSHFSVPNFESVLPWCFDAGKPVNGGATRLCAVALTNVVVGVPFIVHDLAAVAPPPVGYDSVIHVEKSADGRPPESDACFSFSDYYVSAEYIVYFAAQQPQQPQPISTPAPAGRQQQAAAFVSHSQFGAAPARNFYVPSEMGQQQQQFQ
jgi:hypothetical protein